MFKNLCKNQKYVQKSKICSKIKNLFKNQFRSKIVIFRIEKNILRKVGISSKTEIFGQRNRTNPIFNSFFENRQIDLSRRRFRFFFFAVFALFSSVFVKIAFKFEKIFFLFAPFFAFFSNEPPKTVFCMISITMADWAIQPTFTVLRAKITKIEILIKNWSFPQKFEFWSKIEVFLKNLNFGQKLKFCLKIWILVKNWSFPQKF